MDSFSGGPPHDVDLSRIRSQCYRGTAKVSLSALSFDHQLVQEKHREISQKNVHRLVKVFRQTDCLRLQRENFIDAVVEALQSSNLSIEQLAEDTAAEPPCLNIGIVNCLNGLHRIEAAKEFLDDNDKWWVVRLYSTEVRGDVLVRVIESYGNEERPCDGEIFRKIRLYSLENDERSEMRWWAYLDNSKPKDLRQLLKNKRLANAFDKLIHMPGLWAKVQLGALHRLLALRCDEEMHQYLEHISLVWEHILKGTTLSPSVVDAATAESLQTLAPRTSRSDREHVTYLMANKAIFTLVHDSNQRDVLLRNLLSIPAGCLIPTLWTFFETLKYLEPCCEILRKLLGCKMKSSIRSSLTACYFQPKQVMIQTSECLERELIPPVERPTALFVAYTQLWAFCARHFDGLTSSTPRKESGKAKPVPKEPNPVLWQYLAKFAISRGFITPKALELAEQGSKSQYRLAEEYLGRANPMLTTFTSHQIGQVVGTVVPLSNEMAVEIPEDSGYLKLERRFGRPFQDDLARDKFALFLPRIYGDEGYTEATVDCARHSTFTYIFGARTLKNEDLGSTAITVFQPTLSANHAPQQGLVNLTEPPQEVQAPDIVIPQAPELDMPDLPDLPEQHPIPHTPNIDYSRTPDRRLSRVTKKPLRVELKPVGLEKNKNFEKAILLQKKLRGTQLSLKATQDDLLATRQTLEVAQETNRNLENNAKAALAQKDNDIQELNARLEQLLKEAMEYKEWCISQHMSQAVTKAENNPEQNNESVSIDNSAMQSRLPILRGLHFDQLWDGWQPGGVFIINMDATTQSAIRGCHIPIDPVPATGVIRVREIMRSWIGYQTQFGKPALMTQDRWLTDDHETTIHTVATENGCLLGTHEFLIERMEKMGTVQASTCAILDLDDEDM